VMREAGLEPHSIGLPHALHTLEEIRADERLPSLRNLLTISQRPTAIVAYSDMIAIPVLQVAAELGLQLPRDLSLVMIGDGPSRLIGRPVTTVCTNIAQVGHEAVRMLLQKIEPPGQPLPSRAVSPWFFEGDTSGPAPA